MSAWVTSRRRNKFGAVKTVVGGVAFASKREARRYQHLCLLQAAGHISGLQLQPAFDLHALGGVKVARYVADFAYRDETTQRQVVEDVKGMKTPVFRLKAKWLKAEHGIEVVCV